MIPTILKFIFLFLFLTFAHIGHSQTSSSKARKDAMELLAQAKEQMAAEDFTAANKIFREMLDMGTVLPTEMCYFFASTLYQLNQFDNSLRFVEKYESLAGVGGDYYQENLQLKALLKTEMEKVRACSYCDSQGYVLESCQVCEGIGHTLQSCSKCLGHKETKCKTCSGEGVVINKNHFGQRTYNTCQLCSGSGIQTCPQCDGEGKQTQKCQYCMGKGMVRNNNELCQHPEKAN